MRALKSHYVCDVSDSLVDLKSFWALIISTSQGKTRYTPTKRHRNLQLYGKKKIANYSIMWKFIWKTTRKQQRTQKKIALKLCNYSSQLSIFFAWSTQKQTLCKPFDKTVLCFLVYFFSSMALLPWAILRRKNSTFLINFGFLFGFGQLFGTIWMNLT